jgi:PAS domain S-box-containing protein
VPEDEQSYRLLFESNPHPMWVYDCDTLSFLGVNDAAIRNYGYSREEFLATTINSHLFCPTWKHSQERIFVEEEEILDHFSGSRIDVQNCRQLPRWFSVTR